MRGILKLLFLSASAGLLFYFWAGPNHGPTAGARAPHRSSTQGARPPATFSAARTWGNVAALPDHFARHGSDFGARTADEYASLAAELLHRAKVEGLPAKVDAQGVIRVFDPRSGAFGAYNRDGTTKTFFKPGSRGYFERQPGQFVNLRTSR